MFKIYQRLSSPLYCNYVKGVIFFASCYWYSLFSFQLRFKRSRLSQGQNRTSSYSSHNRGFSFFRPRSVNHVAFRKKLKTIYGFDFYCAALKEWPLLRVVWFASCSLVIEINNSSCEYPAFALGKFFCALVSSKQLWGQGLVTMSLVNKSFFHYSAESFILVYSLLMTVKTICPLLVPP